MTQEEYMTKSNEEAAKVLSPTTYQTLIKAFTDKVEVSLSYIRKDGLLYRYHKVLPISFFYTPYYSDIPEDVYLWAWHDICQEKHSFRAWAISEATIMGNIIVACIDPQLYRMFLAGEATISETTLI